jgi:glycosyltransferase involved in cell wall biosynthesis
VPVIAPDLPAMRDLVEPGVTGWLAPTSGPDDLAFALTAALNGPTESLRRGRAARRRAEAHSLAASVEAHLRLYRAQA